MQTILGANGQIAEELAKELHRNFMQDIRLVSRSPKKVNETDSLFPANLLDKHAADAAVEGSEVAYLTVGLPMDSALWETHFPVIMNNVISACRKHQCKLAFFDNTYMYPKTEEPQTEQTPFAPVGRKSVVRAQIAQRLLDEMKAGHVEAFIGRAPEFYGPGKTQSLTNTFIFDNIKANKTLKVPLRDDRLRTLIWTPDASRALALLGNTPDAYGQTWHLPCDDNRLTYKQCIDLAGQLSGRLLRYSVLKKWMFGLGGLFSKQAREVQELLPRYEHDNLFVSDKFRKRFPDFSVTSYMQGIDNILNGL